jgi:hypothetical protein
VPCRDYLPAGCMPTRPLVMSLREDQAMEERQTAAAMGETKKTNEDYHNPRLSMDGRVDDLLGRMTLAEKAGMCSRP